jgi:hypothetical protein
LHANGGLTILAAVHGDVSATGLVQDTLNHVVGEKTSNADAVTGPAISSSDYTSYRLSGTSHCPASLVSNTFAANDPLANGQATSPANPGGVVKVDPVSGTTVTLADNLNFRGTLVVNGNLKLGANVTLTAEDGFPAVVVTGRIYVTSGTNATINGLVVADKGISPYGASIGSRTVINGGLLCQERLYDITLSGQHELNFDADRCRVYDVKDPLGKASVEVVTWKD